MALAGGTDAILRCGPVYTGAFHAPAVAWALDVHLDQVELPGLALADEQLLGHVAEVAPRRRVHAHLDAHEAVA